MMVPHFTLPDGRRGQALAVALTVIVVAVLWLCTGAPCSAGTRRGRIN